MRIEDILHEPGNELMKFSPPSDGMPTPGFVDCFLATATAGWKGAGALLRRFVTDWKEANGIPVERSPEAEAALAEIPEEDRERYDRAETEADVISQREAIEAERYSDFLYERAGIAGTLGTFAGHLADPAVLAEGAATAPLMGPIGEAVAGFAGFASRSLGVKVGFEGLLKGTAAGKILKAAGHGGTSAAIFSLIDAGRKKYIGIPIENLGADVGWNSLLGACLGGIGSGIGMLAGKLRANRTELKESFGESIMSDFSPSDIEVVADADGNVTGAAINGKKTSSLAKYCSFSPTSIGVYGNNSVLKRITLASFNTNHEGAPAITTEYRYALQINKGEAAASEINKLKELAIKSGRVESPERFDDICFSAMTTGTPSGIPEIDKAALITGRKYFDSMRDLGLELRLFDRALGKRYIFPEGNLDDLVQQAVTEGKGGETVERILKTKDDLRVLRQTGGDVQLKETTALLNKELDKAEKELRELLKRERPLLQEDLDEAVRESGNARYAPIVFDAVKIRDNPAAFRDTMVRCLMRYDRMTERAALNTVEDMITRIYGGEQSGYFSILRARAGKAGATKERVFRIPSTELIDFLVTDPERLIRHQARTFGYDIAEAQTLRELGFQSWEAVMSGVSEEAARQGFPKGTEKILKYARQIPFIIKGQINPPPITFGDRLLNASIQSMKTLNYVTLMGKVILGCAEDFAMTFAKRGLFRHIGELLNYRKTPHFFSKEELKMFGICLDDVSKTPYGFMDTFSDFARKGVRTFGRMTGVPQFENLRAGFLANLTAKDLSQAILEGATSVPGLKESEVNTIRGMLQKHAVKDGKLVTDLQLSLWDEDAAILFMGKIRRMVSQYIVRPNAGDMPLFLRKPAGQMFSMFTSWAFALHNQILLPLLESGKHAELAKMMVYGFGLGFLTEQIRSYIRGEVPDATDPQFLERTVTRMPLGVFGLLGEYIADLSRKENQSARNMIYTLAKKGNLRYPLELFDVAHYPFREQPLTEKERRRALALIPFNNLLYINPIVNYFTADK